MIWLEAGMTGELANGVEHDQPLRRDAVAARSKFFDIVDVFV